MSGPREIGVAHVGRRFLIATVFDPVDPIDWPNKPFGLLVAAGRSFDDSRWLQFVSASLDAGCVHVTTWGPRCSELHDLFDIASNERLPHRGSEAVLMTAWFANDPLSEAAFYLARCAYPDPDYADDPTLMLTVVVGDEVLTAEAVNEIRILI